MMMASIACNIFSGIVDPHLSINEDIVHLQANITPIIPNNPLSCEIEIPAYDKDCLCFSKS